jgi:glutaredoxin
MLMKVIRWPIGQLILLLNFIFSPRSPKRSIEQQAVIDAKTKNLSLYQLPSCPFCVKVRRTIKREGLNINLRNIKGDNEFSQELTREGGKRKVPCLRIENTSGEVQWLYESNDVVAHLQAFANAS